MALDPPRVPTTLLLAALLLPAEAASWPKADRWISWWFMPYVQNVSGVQSQALVATVREHRDAFDSLIVYCGHNLGTDGSLTVDQPLLDFCNATLLGPLHELGVVVELVVGGGRSNASDMRRGFGLARDYAARLVEDTQRYGVQGWSFDWEPAGPTTYPDRLSYASFLGQLRAGLARLLHRELARALQQWLVVQGKDSLSVAAVHWHQRSAVAALSAWRCVTLAQMRLLRQQRRIFEPLVCRKHKLIFLLLLLREPRGPP